MDIAVQIAIGVVTVALGSIAGAIAARRELRHKYDESLRDLRIEAYEKLWAALEPLSKYGRAHAVSRDAADALRSTLVTWYFETGGLVLSTRTRGVYFALVEGLEIALVDPAPIDDAQDEYLRVLGSRLRTAMTRDVGTRWEFMFRADPPDPKADPKTGTYRAEDGSGTIEITQSRHRWRVPRRGGQPLAISAPASLAGARYDASWEGIAATRIEAREEPDERWLLIEDDLIVEGPRGWTRGSTRIRRRPVRWPKAG